MIAGTLNVEAYRNMLEKRDFFCKNEIPLTICLSVLMVKTSKNGRCGGGCCCCCWFVFIFVDMVLPLLWKNSLTNNALKILTNLFRCFFLFHKIENFFLIRCKGLLNRNVAKISVDQTMEQDHFHQINSTIQRELAIIGQISTQYDIYTER